MRLKDIDFRVWDISEKVFYNDLGLSILPSTVNLGGNDEITRY